MAIKDRRDGAAPLKKVFENMIEDMGLGHKIKETKVLECIPEFLGTAIDRKITERYIHDQKLFIRTNSAPLRNELFLIKDALFQKIIGVVGQGVIKDIVVR
ncbi:MAG: DUF721 domain-containing protein [Bacteroidetes bacterium]|nr:DUF721 domain-containing protein [Bacteroidota bacterium]